MYEQYLSIIDSLEIPIVIPKSGDIYKMKDMYLTVIYPDSIQSMETYNINNASIVFRLNYFENSIEQGTNSELTNQARFFIGKMHEEKKRYSKATKYYKALVEEFGVGEFAERAAWQLGWLNYTKGDHQKALKYFEDSARSYPSGLFIESSMFWNAKSAEKLKRKNLAQQLFHQNLLIINLECH